MNKQRETIYRLRREFMNAEGDVLRERVEDMLDDEMKFLVEGHTAHLASYDWNTEEVAEQVRAMNIPADTLHTELLEIKNVPKSDEEKRDEAIDLLQKYADEAFSKKAEEMGENMKNVFRYFALQTIDYLWSDHFECMDYTRSSLRLRAYGQRYTFLE